MKIGKFAAFAAATALAAAPALAQSAAPLSVAGASTVRASASVSDENDLRGNRSAAMVIGFVILVAIIAVALSNGDGPDSP